VKRVITLTMLAASVVLAPTAHADDEQGYLDELRQAGMPVLNQAGALRAGRMVCDDLHRGMSPEDVMHQEFGPFGSPWSGPMVGAAQHHLCPDTLH
jgi:hypothetical protein